MPNFSIQAPDGKTYDIEGPDQAGALDALKKHLGSQPAPQGLDTGDIAKSAGTGLVRGAEGMAGLPADVATSSVPSTIGQKIFDPVFHFFEGLAGQTPAQSAARDTQSAKTQEAILGGAKASLPTSQNIAAAVEPVITGGQGLHEPASTAGKYAETAGEFASGALGGGLKGLLGRVTKFGIVPGLASEAAGQATAGTPFEGAARFAAGLAAGGINALERDPAAARVDKLEMARDAYYKAADTKGVILSPSATTQGMGGAVAAAQREGFKDYLHPASNTIIKAIRDEVRANQGALALKDVDQIRQALNARLRSTAVLDDDKRVLRSLKTGIDTFVDNLKPSQIFVSQGTSSPAQVIDFLKQGRALHSQVKKSEIIQEVFDKAEQRAGANQSVPGKQSALVQEFKNLANSRAFKANPNFTPAERAAINQVATGGGPIEKIFGLIGSIHGLVGKGEIGKLAAGLLSPIKEVAGIGGKVRAGVARDTIIGGQERALAPGAVAGQVSGDRAPTYGGAQQ